MFMKVLLVLAAIIALFLIFAAFQPNTFRVERSTTIKAAPAKIIATLNDFHNWSAWSPWEKMDPAMKRTFGGAASGKGATYSWEGNDKVGTGAMEITDSSPNKVTIKLDFLKPFEAHNTAEFTVQPSGDASQVTWAMYGPSPYMMKVMHLVMNMDKMIGKDFDSGLANLKALSEK